MMKVLFLPYGEANEYHNLLSSAVQAEGIDVLEGNHKIDLRTRKGLACLFFPLLQHAVSYEVDVIHLFWTHPFFIMAGYSGVDAIDRVLSFVRSIIFIFNVIGVKILGVNIVWTAHNKYNHEQYHIGIDLMISRVLVTFCDAITVECSLAKEVVVELFHVADGSKVHVVPEGNYIPAYENTVEKDAAKAEVGVEPADFLFMFFGMVRPYKGVDRLLEAFDATTLDARLFVAGSPVDDESRESVTRRASAEGGINTVLEYIPNDEVQVYMNAADVVVLPYREILTSGSLLLAMSFGRPVVAPAIGCIPEVAGAEANFLYDPDEADGLEAAMNRARRADDLEGRGRENLERAEALSWDGIGVMTADLYRTVA
jgi:glycosyltransferase involved in cell wall biosynthesis